MINNYKLINLYATKIITKTNSLIDNFNLQKQFNQIGGDPKLSYLYNEKIRNKIGGLTEKLKLYNNFRQIGGKFTAENMTVAEVHYNDLEATNTELQNTLTDFIVNSAERRTELETELETKHTEELKALEDKHKKALEECKSNVESSKMGLEDSRNEAIKKLKTEHHEALVKKENEYNETKRELETKIKELETEKKELETKKTELETGKKQAEKEREMAKILNGNITEKINKCNEEIKKYQELLKKNVNDNKLATNESEKKHTDAINNLESKHKSNLDELESKHEVAIDELTKKWDEEKKKLESDHKSNLKDLNDKITELEAEITKLKTLLKDCVPTKVLNENIITRITKLNNYIATLNKNLPDFNSKIYSKVKENIERLPKTNPTIPAYDKLLEVFTNNITLLDTEVENLKLDALKTSIDNYINKIEIDAKTVINKYKDKEFKDLNKDLLKNNKNNINIMVPIEYKEDADDTKLDSLKKELNNIITNNESQKENNTYDNGIKNYNIIIKKYEKLISIYNTKLFNILTNPKYSDKIKSLNEEINTI